MYFVTNPYILALTWLGLRLHGSASSCTNSACLNEDFRWESDQSAFNQSLPIYHGHNAEQKYGFYHNSQKRIRFSASQGELEYYCQYKCTNLSAASTTLPTMAPVITSGPGSTLNTGSSVTQSPGSTTLSAMASTSTSGQGSTINTSTSVTQSPGTTLFGTADLNCYPGNSTGWEKWSPTKWVLRVGNPANYSHAKINCNQQYNGELLEPRTSQEWDQVVLKEGSVFITFLIVLCD